MADNSLLPVVVGGLLTMGGVAISGGITFFVHWLDRSEEKRKRGADKFEELVKSIYEFDEWLNMKEADMAFGQKIKLDISPFAKIEGISAVYFPAFMKKISELQAVSIDYMSWMAQIGQRRLKGEMPDINESLPKVYTPYLRKRDELMTELGKYASENF